MILLPSVAKNPKATCNYCKVKLSDHTTGHFQKSAEKARYWV